MNGEQLFLNELKDYINSGMSKNDLKTLINQRLKEVETKQCNIANVVNRRELLLDFANYSESDIISQTTDECVDNYLDSIK